jgi:hypothetical protein
VTAIAANLRSGRHDLSEIDYGWRLIGALFQDYNRARPIAEPVQPEDLCHPDQTSMLRAIRSIERTGKVPTVPRVREVLIERQCSATVQAIPLALESYVASADGPRLHLFVQRIIALAELRRLLALADRVDFVLGDRRLDLSSAIGAAHQMMRESLGEFAVELADRKAA